MNNMRACYDCVFNMIRLKQAMSMLSLGELEQVDGWLQPGASSYQDLSLKL